MGLAEFDIVAGPDGRTVVVNGEDVSAQVSGFRVDSAPGDVPRVYLHHLGDLRLAGEGIIVAVDPAGDESSAVVAFLDAIDPGTLDAKVLDGVGLGDPGTPAQAYLDVLKGWARGD